MECVADMLDSGSRPDYQGIRKVGHHAASLGVYAKEGEVFPKLLYQVIETEVELAAYNDGVRDGGETLHLFHRYMIDLVVAL